MFHTIRPLLGQNFERIESGIFETFIANLLSFEGKVRRQIKVDDRGDGYKGRVDILLELDQCWVGIEIDRKTPREKSIYKLKQLNCDRRFVFTRSPFTITEIL